jgi:SMODS and SLOG-associating 2TM effector domain 3/SMODS and SLOG-associating 2TM effector domain 1
MPATGSEINTKVVPAWELTFPPLYATADEAANRWQMSYLRLIRAEYGLLLVAAVLAMNFSTHGLYFAMYGLVFLASLGVLLYRTGEKPEQDWYRCRALAESVKTSTWRYVMRAEPFAVDDGPARGALRDMLGQLLRSNEHIVQKLAGYSAAGSPTTTEMDQVRVLDWRLRRDYYVHHRIRNQRDWYHGKAKYNADSAGWWRSVSIAIYVAAVALVLARIAIQGGEFWPIEPLVVAASAVLGWMQIKKFNELASAYTLTALEISLIEDKLREVETEAELSEFVNEAELAFSREHTQWVARQTNRY